MPTAPYRINASGTQYLGIATVMGLPLREVRVHLPLDFVHRVFHGTIQRIPHATPPVAYIARRTLFPPPGTKNGLSRSPLTPRSLPTPQARPGPRRNPSSASSAAADARHEDTSFLRACRLPHGCRPLRNDHENPKREPQGTSLSFHSPLSIVLPISSFAFFSPMDPDQKDPRHQSFESAKRRLRDRIDGLPRGVVQSTSDMELKPLWKSSSQRDISGKYTTLLAMAVGISQKRNVDILVFQFLIDNCSIILFHYDGNVDGWHDLEWSDKAIHILAHNQTKWWFAKRFLHPDVVSTYDYIFLWDEDLGVENFHLGRYLQIMASEGLEISQPALDPDQSSEIHHRITVRDRKAKNDLIHGWGLDMKLGYCAQGDRTKKVGVIDTEYIIHQGIPSLGGASVNKLFSYVAIISAMMLYHLF
ncbi:hypothetical protein COCNU_09G006970 [Cocos nucifera]|uniref:Uncharacterized protein n=1 Tax=Cocos nucifera TaxID=13894 RepID=A0A8K0N7J6_COCNU|nr:hypothetical protein COCNU_09G006970 [Cocos nucifera]